MVCYVENWQVRPINTIAESRSGRNVVYAIHQTFDCVYRKCVAFIISGEIMQHAKHRNRVQKFGRRVQWANVVVRSDGREGEDA